MRIATTLLLVGALLGAPAVSATAIASPRVTTATVSADAAQGAGSAVRTVHENKTATAADSTVSKDRKKKKKKKKKKSGSSGVVIALVLVILVLLVIVFMVTKSRRGKS
ncbi:hypothetical protein [Streptomyces sp. A5-4]|uniref:hypothetical protein n=1 Tax=Streptomyces sp. A5-4 TaxID=3384771 RepID=UPI003DA9F9C1